MKKLFSFTLLTLLLLGFTTIASARMQLSGWSSDYPPPFPDDLLFGKINKVDYSCSYSPPKSVCLEDVNQRTVEIRVLSDNKIYYLSFSGPDLAFGANLSNFIGKNVEVKFFSYDALRYSINKIAIY